MIKIRKFNLDDYNQLIDLWIKSKLPYKPKGRDNYYKIKKEIKKENSVFLVAEDNETIIGSIFGTHDGRKGWINRLAILPQYQRRGIAKKLCINVEKKLNKLGIEIIGCLIEDYNLNSFGFFKSIGYNIHNDITYISKRKNDDI
jgi:ribosomal protein S18 acetylase RimI-like enzyme